MDFIIDFYKSLDALNLIIFWGIIIVIVLLLIFSIILINKNKKLKILIEQKDKEKKENEEKNRQIKENDDLPIIDRQEIEVKREQEPVAKPIETEKNFVAEEHVIEYNKELFSLPNIKKASEYEDGKTNYGVNKLQQTSVPTGPYQKNVLREMSLSQTSPIGINRQPKNETVKKEIEKNTEVTLEHQLSESKQDNQQIITSQMNENNKMTKINEEGRIRSERLSPPKKEMITEHEIEIERPKSLQPPQSFSNKVEETKYKEKSHSEKYLEEVSRKLAEAEIPDEIERTNYELEQEENAIISYKELMEKKDSIQTIDEEEAVISIEELMQRQNGNFQAKQEDAKLYKLNEDSGNENFIKELKQFRNDL